MSNRPDHFLNSSSYKDGDFLIGAGMGAARHHFDQEILTVADFFQNILITSSFIQDNPHILFSTVQIGPRTIPPLSIAQAQEIAHDRSVANLPSPQRQTVLSELYVAMIRNFELYQLVADPRGTLLRWGKALDEEEHLQVLSSEPSLYIRGLPSYLQKLANAGKVVSWWSRSDVRKTPHFAGGKILRTTSLSKIKNDQSHWVGLDIHEGESLVLVKK